MVRLLEDLCLRCIARNMAKLPASNLQWLTVTQKEVLLERMASHQLLTSAVLPLATVHLLDSHLRTVVLDRCSQITDDVLAALGCKARNLVKIRVTSCPNVSDAGLKGLLMHQQSLADLTLKGMSQLVRGTFLSAINCPETLTSVSLKNSRFIFASLVPLLVERNRRIAVLDVQNIHNLDDATIAIIAQALGKDLISLNVSKAAKISRPSLHALSTHCPNLERLVLNSVNSYNGEGLNEVIKCCNISVLDMAFCFFLSGSAVGEIFQDQERRATLQRLHNCSTVPDHYLMQGVNSSALTQLEHLDLSGSPIADAAVQFLCEKLGAQLASINLAMCRNIGEQTCVSIATYCTALVSLNMAIHSQMTCAGLFPLFCNADRASQFTHLDFDGCAKLAGSVLEEIASSCVNAQSLNFSTCEVLCDSTLVHIGQNCPHLTSLGVKRCNDVSVTASFLPLYLNTKRTEKVF
eukprot:scpid71717/ scgid1566/ F-box/LRR-repeat protein 4